LKSSNDALKNEQASHTDEIKNMRAEVNMLRDKVLKYEVEGINNFQSEDSNIIPIQKDKLNNQMAYLVKLLGEKHIECKSI
jgi:hypothetical protein